MHCACRACLAGLPASPRFAPHPITAAFYQPRNCTRLVGGQAAAPGGRTQLSCLEQLAVLREFDRPPLLGRACGMQEAMRELETSKQWTQLHGVPWVGLPAAAISQRTNLPTHMLPHWPPHTETNSATCTPTH